MSIYVEIDAAVAELKPAKEDVAAAPVGLAPNMEEVEAAAEGSVSFFDSSFFSSSFFPLS